MKDLSNQNQPNGFPPDAFGIGAIDPLQPLRFPARVDMALDRVEPHKAFHRLINNRSSQPPDAQQGIVGALLNEELHAFHGLQDQDYRSWRLGACISAFDRVVGHSHVQHLSVNQTTQAIQLYRDQLIFAAGREALSQLHYQLISHAAKALLMFSGLHETRPLVEAHVEDLARSARWLIKDSQRGLSLNTSGEKLSAIESLCQLAKPLRDPELYDAIISLEPHLRGLYQLLDSSRSAAECENISRGSIALESDDEFNFQASEGSELWFSLYSAVVDILIRHASEKDRDLELLGILRTMPSDAPGWPEALSALACHSKDMLESFLPSLIERSLDSEEAVAAAISLLALPYGKHSSPEAGKPGLSFNPYKLLARHLLDNDTNTIIEFLDHARDVIKENYDLFLAVPQPKKLLKKLKRTIKKLDRD